MNSSSNISITIQDIQFAKDYQYFITIQFLNEKKRTDLSAVARNPIFTTNTFLFPLKNNNNPVVETVTFTACVVVEQGLNQQQRGQSKILGEATIDLSPYSLQPSDIYNSPIRQQMKFTRMKDGKQIPVGRFIATFKIVNETLAQSFIQNASFKKLENQEIYQELPQIDNLIEFIWRVRADIRCAYNLPTNNDMTPQAYVEIGWTEYKNTSPQESRVFQTNIVNSTNPYWNSEFLINNPPSLQEKKGFISISLKDKNIIENIYQVFIPIESMNPFTPYNLNIIKKQSIETNFFVSLVFETPIKPNEKIFDIIISDILFDPLPKTIDKMALILTTQDNQPKLKFYPFNEKEDSIQRILQFDDTNEFSYFMSQMMKVPPIKSSRAYKAACLFSIPESFLFQNTKLFLAIKNENQFEVHQLANQIVGNTMILDQDLNKLLIQKSKKRLFFQINFYKDPNNPFNIGKNKCQIQIGSIQNSVDNNKSILQSSQVNQIKHTNSVYNSIILPNNQSLNNKNIAQNNQILNRILKQLDDKTQSLKIAASQIIDLRKKIKLLQSQNNILRQQSYKGEDQIRDLISREVENLGSAQLRDKVIKVAAMYKNERVKVKELESTLRTLEPQVANTMQLNSNISNLNNHIQTLNTKLLQYKKEFQRINVYKQTIKKQEKVIQKLERVLTQNLKDIKRARQDRIQLQELKKQKLNNRNNQMTGSRQSTRNRGDQNQQYKEEILRLQKIIVNLQDNIKNGRVQPNYQDQQRMQLEFKLHKAQSRVNALEQQMTMNAKNYAKEIAKYKLMIAQKQALLDGFSIT